MNFMIILMLSQTWNGGEAMIEPRIVFNYYEQCERFWKKWQESHDGDKTEKRFWCYTMER